MTKRKRRPKARRAEALSTARVQVRFTVEERAELERRRRRRQLRTLSELIRLALFPAVGS